MEVKIGIKGAGREIVLESEQSADDVLAAVKSALADDSGILDLTDEKGRRVLVPAEKIAFVEIGTPERGRVGFGAM